MQLLCALEDGWWQHPKHVEQCQIEINSVNCVSSWNYMQQKTITCLKLAECFLVGMKAQWMNTAGQSHRWRGGHAAADRVPVCWSLDFNWTPLYIHIQVTTCVLNYDLHKIDLSRIIQDVLLRPSGSVCKFWHYPPFLILGLPVHSSPLRLPIECLNFVSLHFSSHPIFVDIIAVTIILCEKYKLWNPHFVISQPPVISCFVCPNVPVGILFSYTLLQEQVSQLCKTNGCISVINTRCVDGRRSTKKNTDYS